MRDLRSPPLPTVFSGKHYNAGEYSIENQDVHRNHESQASSASSIYFSGLGWNIQGFTPEKEGDQAFLDMICGVEPKIRNLSIFACIDNKRGATTIDLEGFTAYPSPRTDICDGKHVTCTDGGVVLYVAEALEKYFVQDHTSVEYPEVAAVEFAGALFGVESNVIIIAAYISCALLPASKRYFDSRHISQTDALAELIRAFRFAGYEVLVTGDFNAYTVDHCGFAGDETQFDHSLPGGIDWPIRRKSGCSHRLKNTNGRELISLCQSCELVLVNGVTTGSKNFDSSCTRNSTRVAGGSVIDYVAASPNVFASFDNLEVVPPVSSDNKLVFGWYGKPLSSSLPTRPMHSSCELRDGPEGWCFLGSLSEELQNDFVARLMVDPRLGQISALCDDAKFTQKSAEFALHSLHELIRDSWQACGLKVHKTTGARPSSDTVQFANRVPIESWFDDEAKTARDRMYRAR